MDIINEALQFEQQKTTFKTTSDRIVASRKAKDLILSLNEIYKEGEGRHSNGPNEKVNCD